MRGKILNVERARFDRMLGSQEIGTLITALGTGIGRDDFNADKLRYHKIIIMTDADVDGSHIRTLLLTFFFRQMPELITRGHLFIAQPPLYKVKRGSSEMYLKDERAREDYLIAHGLDGAVLRLATGEERAGADLRALVEEARQVRHLLGSLHSRYDRTVVEQAAIAGALLPIDDDADAGSHADILAGRLRCARRRHGARLGRPARERRLRPDPRAARRHPGGGARCRPARLRRGAAPLRPHRQPRRGLRQAGPPHPQDR